MANSQPKQSMRVGLAREKNPNWGGGRSIASNGYVLIKVGIDHHLADVRGYAYEHRLAAEQKLGRRLLPGEIVHHRDENKQNNAPDNLEVVGGNAEHYVHHRKRTDLRLPGEDNPTIKCACGCCASLFKYDNAGRPRTFLSGHNGHSSPVEAAILDTISVHGTLLLREMVGNTGFGKASVLRALKRLVSSGRLRKVGHGAYAYIRQQQGA